MLTNKVQRNVWIARSSWLACFCGLGGYMVSLPATLKTESMDALMSMMILWSVFLVYGLFAGLWATVAGLKPEYRRCLMNGLAGVLMNGFVLCLFFTSPIPQQPVYPDALY